MARVKYGSLVSQISGSVGHATFQNSQGGAILRNKPIPSYSSSSAQVCQRSAMSELQSAWLALTPAARLKWCQFVAFSSQHIKRDDNILISGYNLFLKYQTCRKLYYLPLLTSWSYNPLLVIPDQMIIRSDNSNMVVIFNNVVNSSQYFFVLKLSPPQRSSTKFSLNNCRFIKIPMSSAPFFFITAEYKLLFHNVAQILDTVHYSIYYFSTVNPLLTAYSTGVLTVQPL
jgi:hypothetical protein